jgi:membrane protease YdiL (CAAX protease family)
VTLPLDAGHSSGHSSGYFGGAMFLREPDEPDARAVLFSDLVRGGEVRSSTLVSEDADGPFLPLSLALASNTRVRATFARALEVPSLLRWKRVRVLGLAALVPVAMLFELDLERSLLGARTAGVTAVTGLVALGVVLWDLLRTVPVWPRTSAIVFLAAAARFVTFLAYSCGKTRPAGAAVYGAGLTALVASSALFVLAPTRRRIVRECLAAMGIGRIEAATPKQAPAASLALLAAAAATGLALPVLVALAQRAGVPFPLTAIGFAAYAVVAPACIERYLERTSAPERAAWRGPEALRRASVVALVAFVMTAGLAGGARHALDAVAGIAECLRPGGASATFVRQIAEEQRIEVARNVARDETGVSFVILTVLLVPLVEERIYRGLVQRILARRLDERAAIGAAALLFGLAHLGVYRVAIYQTCLLGVSFGIAYAEGGIVAAVLAHAAWNLHLLF